MLLKANTEQAGCSKNLQKDPFELLSLYERLAIRNGGTLQWKSSHSPIGLGGPIPECQPLG